MSVDDNKKKNLELNLFDNTNFKLQNKLNNDINKDNYQNHIDYDEKNKSQIKIREENSHLIPIKGKIDF